MRSGLVGRYYLHRAAMTTGFFWPIFPLFLRARGVSFTGIGTLLAIEAAVVILAEVPTGFVGDAIGRKRSLVAGTVLTLVAELGFVVAHEFRTFAVIYACFGLARTFQSGSGDAWLYDVLGANHEEGEFTRIRGRGGSVTHWASTGAMIASGLLYAVNPNLPFLASAALAAVDVGVLLSFPASEDAEVTRVSAAETIPLLSRTLQRSSVWSFVAVAAIFFGIERAVSEFIPHATASVLGGAIPLPADGGASGVVFIGVFFAGFTATSAVASMYAGPIRQRFGAPATLAGTGFLSALLLAGTVLVRPIAVVGFVVVKTADALLLPVVNGYVNDVTETAGRATTLSAISMLFNVSKMPLLVGAGAVADLTNVFVAVSALGVSFVLLATAVFLVEVPVEAPITSSSGMLQK